MSRTKGSGAMMVLQRPCPAPSFLQLALVEHWGLSTGRAGRLLLDVQSCEVKGMEGQAAGVLQIRWWLYGDDVGSASTRFATPVHCLLRIFRQRVCEALRALHVMECNNMLCTKLEHCGRKALCAFSAQVYEKTGHGCRWPPSARQQ
jgi:hypothetical protein